MKSRENKVYRIGLLVIAIAAIAFLGSMVLKNNVERSYSINSGIVGIQEYVDENDNPTKVSFVLEDVNIDTLKNMTSSKYKITSGTATLSFMDSQTNEEIVAESGVVSVGDTGVTITLNGISKGSTYDVTIEPVESEYGFASEFKKAIVTIDYSNKLHAYVKEVRDKDNNSVEVDDKAILLFTEEDNTVKLRANEDVDLEYTFSLVELSDDELASATWRTYDKDNYLAIETNGYLYAKAKYKTNGYSKINMLHITNIDKLLPSITNVSVVLNSDGETATVSYSFDDAEATLEYGKSGVEVYAFSPSSRITDDKYVEVSEGQTSASSVVEENGTYYIHIRDRAGNKAVEPVEVNIIPERPEEYVLIVLDSPEPRLNGMLFSSLKKLTNKITEFGLTKDDKVLAQVLTNIRNQETDINNMDLTLDLNGYTIQSRNGLSIFDIKNTGSLKLGDYKYEISDYISETSWNDVEYSQFENGTDPGSVISTADNAVTINEGGTLTLGDDNSPDLLHIEYPDHVSPYLEGSSQAVLNNGTFNYYDGILVGDIALNGEVQDTPFLYDPSAVDNDGRHYMTLEKVTNIEALIGKTRFTLLEDAVAYANDRVGTSEDQIEIDIVAELDKAITVEVDNTKNIILDLNGHSYSNHITGDIIENYGKLVIIDSGDTGNIFSNNSNVIDNHTGAFLEIRDGLIKKTNNGQACIYNNQGAEVLITGGQVTSNSTSITNKGGKLTVEDGTITGTISNEDVVPTNEFDSTEEIALDSIISTSAYPFVYSNGKVRSSNYGHTYTTTFGYYELDLTEYQPYEKFRVEADVTVTAGRNYYYWAFGHIDEQTQSPGYNDSYNMFKQYEAVNNAIKGKVVDGGKKYYIHFGYIIRNVSTDASCRLEINSVKVKKVHSYYGEMHFNGGTINSVSNQSYADRVFITEGEITAFSNTRGSALMTGGHVKTLTHNASNYGYEATMTVSGGTVDNMTVSGYTSTTFANISGGTFGNTKFGGDVHITGGTFTGAMESGSILDIENAYISGTLEQKAEYDLSVRNTTFERKTTGTPELWSVYIHPTEYDFDPSRRYTTTFKDCIFKFDAETVGAGSPSYVGIKNSATGPLVLDGTTMDLKITDTYEGNRGTDTAQVLVGIYNYAKNYPNVTIKNSSISTITTAPNNLLGYGIITPIKGKMVIGTKDDTYNKSTTSITSSYVAISNNSGEVDIYDGVLKGKTKALNTVVNDIEDNYYVHHYSDDDYDIIELSQEQINNVLNVEKNKYYSTIGAALAEADANNTIRVVADELYEPKLTISASNTNTIDFNSKTVLFGTIVNNGNIAITDTGAESSIKTSSIINNNELYINGGNYRVQLVGEYGVINYGKLELTDSTFNTASTYQTNYLYKREYNGILFDNYNILNVKTGTTLGVSIQLEYAINNHHTGTVTYSGGTANAPIKNAGTFNVTGGNINTSLKNGAEWIGPTVYSQEKTDVYDQWVNIQNGRYETLIHRSYIIIDLTDKEGMYYVDVYKTITNGGTSVGYGYTTEATGLTGASTTTGDNDRQVTTYNLYGGSMYYLHIDTNYGYNIYDIKLRHGDEVEDYFAHGNVNISGGTLKYLTTHSATVNMTGGTIVNDGGNYAYAVTAGSHGTFNFSGGTIEGNPGNGIIIQKGGYATVTGGLIKNAYVGIEKSSTLDLVIDDVTITSTISANVTGILVNAGKVIMNDGTIDLQNSSSGELKGVSVSSGSFEMNDGSIKVETSGNYSSSSYGISTYGSVSVYGGSIESKGINTSQSYIGIFGPGDSAPSVQLGKNDETVSKTNPMIKGVNYGIYKKNGDFKFYDGIIKGNETFYGGVTDRPEEYELEYGTEDTLKTVVLSKFELIENEDTGRTYGSLKSAVEACTDNVDCNLKVLYDFTISGVNEIKAAKKVNLNINEKTISALADNYILNKGTLKITNGTMRIQSGSKYESIIDNYGTLELGTGGIIDVLNFNTVRGIVNRRGATFNMTDGKITGTGYNESGYQRKGSGSGFYNEGGTANLTGGQIIDNANGGSHSIIASAQIFTGEVYTKASGYTWAEPIVETIAAPKNSSNNPAAAYIPIDLTNVSGKVIIELGCSGTVSNPSSSDTMRFRVREDTDFTDIANTFDMSASPKSGTYYVLRKEVDGGKLYYLQLSLGRNGYVSALKYYNDEVSHNYFDGETNINGTEIINNTGTYGVYVYGGVLNYTGATIKSTTSNYGTGIFADAGAIINVTNGTITNKQNGIYVNDKASVVNINNLSYVNSAPPENSYGIYMNGGRATINGFDMNVTNAKNSTYGIYMNDNINAVLDNSNIDISGSAGGNYFGIVEVSKNNLVIDNSTIKVKNTASSHGSVMGVYMTSTNVVNPANYLSVDNSTIKAEGVSTGSVYGIYSDISITQSRDDSITNHITIGNNDGNVDTDSVLIYGSNMGIQKRYGDMKFFNGTVKGKKSFIYGVTDIPAGYIVSFNTNDSEESMTLVQGNVVEDSNHTGYGTFNAAFEACPDNAVCNLKVLQTNFVGGVATIPENKIINLDFNGKTIHSTKNSYFINNGTLSMTNGTLDLISSYYLTGTIKYEQPMILNNGVLNINEDMTIDRHDYNQVSAIINSYKGTINVNDGLLNSDRGLVLINNQGGIVNVNGGQLQSYGGSLIRTVAAFKSDYTMYYGVSDKPSYTSSVSTYGYLSAGDSNHNEYKIYIPIDLTSYSGNVTVTPKFVNTVYTAVNPKRYNHIALTESTDEPTWITLTDQNTSSYDFTVQGGKVYYLHVRNEWEFKLTDIIINNNGTEESFLSRGTVTVNGGVFDNGTYAIQTGNADVYLNGGLFKMTGSSSEAVYALNRSKIYVTGAAKIEKRNGITLRGSYGSIDGLEIEHSKVGISAETGASLDVYNYKYTYDINNGSDTGYSPKGLVLGSVENHIYNATINVDCSTTNANQYTYGVSASGTTTIDNLTVNIEEHGAGHVAGLAVTGGTTTINDANVTAVGPKSYGLYMSNNTAETILGNHDGTIPSITNPHFTGDTYGAYTTYGKLRFFDGRFTSTNLPIFGNVEEIPEGYRIIGQDNSYYLAIKSSIEDTFELNGIYYQNLDMPISVIKNSSSHTGTINIWNTATLGTTVTIPSGSNVTLALQGHSLDFTGVDTGIINNGTLTVIDGPQDDIDSSTQSYITNDGGIAINNNGTLTIGVSGNKNPNSPIIRGVTAVAGTAPTVNSGAVTSTGNVGSTRNSNSLIEPTFSYKYNNLLVNNLPSDTVLAEMPGIRSVDDLTVWTNQDISVGMTSHNLAVLNVFSGKDNTCTKPAKYTVQIFKNGVLDEFNTFDYIVNKYCLDDEIVIVDKDYFDRVPTQFKGYYLTRLVLNDEDIKIVPDDVNNNSIFKLYYGQEKGDEIEIVNPKTGRNSYKKAFVIVLLIAILSTALYVLIKKHRESLKNNA